MEFFSKVFTWLANLSSKLPQIDLKAYFIVVLAVIAGVGLIVGLTFFGSNAFKLKAACKKIIKYLANVDSIDDDNVGDFTAECFSQKTPASLRESWVEYLGVRFGFPSDLVSEKNVYDREVKKVKDVRANLFIGIALILVAIFAFWGFGTLSAIEMSVVHCAGLLLSAVIYLILVFVNRKQIKTTRDKFYDMQDDLDAKVNFQVEKNFSTDSSPLSDLAAIVDEIIARNTAKEIEIEETEQEPTPIEDLIEELENKRLADEAEEAVKAVEEPKPEPVEVQQPVEEQQDEPTEEPAQEESVTEEPQQEEQAEVQEEQAEETNDQEPEKKEPVALKESLAAAKRAGNAVVGKKFFGEYLKTKYGEGVEVNERENKTSTGLPLADTYFALDSGNRKCFAYAYDIDGASLLLVNADSVLEDNLKPNHENVNLSAFPKSKDTWYSLPLDDSYSEDELKGILDYCYAHALGKDLESAEEEQAEETPISREPVAEEQPQEEPVGVVQEETVEEVVEEPQVEQPEESVNVPVAEEPTETQQEEIEEPVAEESQDEQAEEPVEQVQEEPSDEPVEESVEEVQEEQPSEESVDDEQAEEQTQEESVEEEVEETEEEIEEETTDESEESEDETEEQEESENDETVVYVVDDEEEEEEYVQPSKLSKLSNLTDYMLAQNMSRKVKMQVATMLIGVYNKFKDNPDDKKIIIDCLKKVIFSLQEEQNKPKYVEDAYIDQAQDATEEQAEQGDQE